MSENPRSEAARLLSLARQSVERTCPVDGTVFLARDTRAVYCSKRCLMRKRRSEAKEKAAAQEDQPPDA